MLKRFLNKLFRLFFGNNVNSNKISEFDVITKYIPPKSSINYVDIGAHEGGFASSICSIFNVESMILVEPIPDKFEIIKKRFQDEKAHLFNCVVTDKSCQTDFIVNENDETSSVLELKREMSELSNIDTRLLNKIKCESRILDEIVTESKFDKIDLLKIDVQGAEDKVLMGARKTLGITRVVLIEVSFKELYIGSALFHNIYDQMMENEFILTELHPVYHSEIGELLQSNAIFINKKYKK